jgi:hypothetical protein
MGGPGAFAPGNTPVVHPRGSDPIKNFLAGIGVAGVDASGQAIGSTGGLTHMWEGDRATMGSMIVAQQEAEAQRKQANGGQQDQAQTNAFLAPKTAPSSPMAGNAFMGGNGAVRVNGLTPATLAPGGTPMIGRDYGSAGAAESTPLSAFGQQLLATGGTVNQNGANFSGAGGKLSIAQDMGSIPMGAKPSAPQFDPMAIARYQQALAAGGDIGETLQAYRTEIPKDAQLSEQDMAALAMDDMRINQQAMEVAQYVNARGMGITPNQSQATRDNRMAYIGGLAGESADPAAGGAADVRAKLNQRPMKTVDVIVGDEIVTMDANTRQVVGRAPRTPLPAGYERAEGGIRPMAGSKDATDQATVQRKEDLKRAQDTEKANVVITAIDEVMPKINNLTAGLGGAMTSIVPGTTSYDVGATIDTIKANIGFDQLSAMRAASPTGGALGQVAVQELNFLQATLGNLKQGQSPDKLSDNLYAIKYHYDRWKDTINGVNPDTKPGRMLSPAEVKRMRELKQRQSSRAGNRS